MREIDLSEITKGRELPNFQLVEKYLDSGSNWMKWLENVPRAQSRMASDATRV